MAEKQSLWHRIINYRPDFLIVLIVIAVVAAIIVPVRGEAADVANTITKIAIAVLFFLYGARLSPQEALKGLMHWRLHLLIMAFTFVVFPLIGVAMMPPGWDLGLLVVFGLIISFQVLGFSLVRAAVPRDQAGRALSAANLSFFLGAAVLQGVSGLMAGWGGVAAALATFAAGLLVCSAGFLLLRRRG